MPRSLLVTGGKLPDDADLVFLWESLGPSHHDRLRAVARDGHSVKAIELFARSDVYAWEEDQAGKDYVVQSLARDRRSAKTFTLARAIFESARGAKAAFFCHYNEPGVFLAAGKLRARGVRVFTMIDSKADDRPRSKLLDWPKRIMLSPYDGAIVAGKRSAEYAQSLGVPGERIASHYNTLDIAALRELAACEAVPEFSRRPFLIVARLIAEKNLETALRAFASYRLGGGTRALSIIGDGPEAARLQALANELELEGAIGWRGSRSRGEVAAAMRSALALLLPSTSETYGLVVIEALAQGLPVIVSERAGVVDLPLTNGREGFVTEPDNAAQICLAMRSLDCAEADWRSWSDAASAAAELADARHFVASVEKLVGLERN